MVLVVKLEMRKGKEGATTTQGGMSCRSAAKFGLHGHPRERLAALLGQMPAGGWPGGAPLLPPEQCEGSALSTDGIRF